MAASTLRDARKRAYRQVILDASEEVFAEYGYEAARVQRIADAAGVSVGTIYSVFGSKAELFSVVLTRHLDDIARRASQAALEADGVLQQLERGLDAYVAFMLEHPAFLRIHLGEHAWGLGPTRASAGQLTAWREGLDLLASILEQGIAEGVVIDDDPKRLARSLVAVQQIHLADWVDAGMREPASEVAARLRRMFRTMFCIDRGAEA